MTDPTNTITTSEQAQVLAHAMLRLAPDPSEGVWQTISEPMLTVLLHTASPAGRGGELLDWAAVGRTLFQWARQEGKLKVLPAVERELIIQALLETKGNQVQAAKLLGITRATLRKRVEKFNIKQELAIQ